MNRDFSDIIKRIISEQGGSTEAKNALSKAVKMQFAEELENVNEKERPFTKAYLAQKLHEKGHFNLALCNKTLDTLCMALFDEQAPETPPELAPQPQAMQEPAAEPTDRNAQRRATGKGIFIIEIIILVLLIVIAVGVLYMVLHIKPKTQPLQENTTKQELNLNN
jgi:hypothetical protein